MHRLLSSPSTGPWWRLLLCGVLTVTMLQQAEGQGTIDKRFHLAVQPQFGIVRGHAPLSLSVGLQWASPELMEGRLQLDWYVGTTRLGRYVSSELALSESKVLLDVLLPPVILSSDDAIFSVQGTFITRRGVYDLDVHDVALQPDWRRILLVGICAEPSAMIAETEDSTARRRNPLAGTFRLEPYFQSRFTRRELKVEDTEVDPADLPTDPLQLTAFDLLVIPDDSLPRIKPRQLQALLSWVRAGGSLYVSVQSTVPTSHVEWLNQLAGRDAADAAFLRTAEGRVVTVDETDQGIQRFHRDLGRVAIIVGEAEIPDEQWEQTLLFLWKVRQDRIAVTARDELWKLEQPQIEGNVLLPATLEPQRFWQQPDLIRVLLPETVHGLPLSIVATVLALFLIVIAPGDYLLLGWLKRRRWTWILFPVVSLLFTGSMMWLARQQLGQTSYENAITVVDLGQDGQPVRTSRFEMLYSASNQTVDSDRQQQLMVPLDPNVSRIIGQAGFGGTPREYEQPWTFSGRVARDYTVHRDVQQWSPRMARITTFGANDTVPLTAATRSFQFTLSADGTEVIRREASIPPEVVSLAEVITCRPRIGFFSVVSQLSPTCGGNWEDLSLLDDSSGGQQVVIDITNPAEGQYVITRRYHQDAP